jgi:hypothetical protein
VTSPTAALDLPDTWDSSGQLVVQARQLAGDKA